MTDHERVAVFTGAGSGLGREVTRALLDAGYRGAPAGRRFLTSALLRSARTLADQLSTISSGDPTDPVAAVPVAASNGNHPVSATAGEVS
mgnify:CR=1 FL=1